ncbi:GNAT family N-acetyltransferase [Pueribacillus sp. YX66]|uniref:GNAT family N-acetyltransferase n=1 Tax=Pueribacillus sp. YX66 TaxID=3229242 RepID=UPI00358CFC92
MERITNIVNRVYAVSEGDFWLPGVDRTTIEEIRGYTSKGEIAVARLMGQIVGCIRVRRVDQEIGEFGLLAVDKNTQGEGIGRELVRYAEQKCQKEHLRKMQLELLVPKEGSHPAKTMLKNWYTRIGYKPIYTESLEALFPRLAKMQAIPSKFVIFQKELSEYKVLLANNENACPNKS